MKKICILGNKGFIGSNILRVLEQTFSLTEEKEYDILINCAGFSKMYEGNKNPDKMRTIEGSVLEKIKNYNFKRIIHLSTIYIDVYPQDIYSTIKKEIEAHILSMYDNVTILRLGGVIGKGLKKNIIFDLINNKPLFVTSDSIYNYILVDEIANIILYLINNAVDGIINVGATNSISAESIASLFNKTPIYGPKKEIVIANVDKLKSFYPVKTSEEYIQSFIKNLNILN